MSKKKSSHGNSSPHFNMDFDPQTGICIPITPYISRICAPNSGPYTFTGTNTYLVGQKTLFIIDPGPKNAAHLDAIMGAVAGREVKAILLTHTHKDHCTGAKQLQSQVKAPLWFEGKHRLSRPKRGMEVNLISSACDWEIRPDRILSDNEKIRVDNFELEIITTPGHCANHLCFGVSDTPYLFSGDHVMGWNSTLIATPDGSMSDYFNSLARIIKTSWEHYLPAHGASISADNGGQNGPTYTKALRHHRMMRNSQILELVGQGASSIKQIVSSIYPQANINIRIAAAMTVQAHIEYLELKSLLLVQRKLTGQTILPITN